MTERERSSVHTRVSDALEAAREERRRVRAKRSAFGEFERTLEEIPARRATGAGHGDVPSPLSVQARGEPTASVNRCRQVRKAFVGMIRPRLGDGVSNPLSGAIEAELGTEIALALDPRTDAGFAPRVKEVLLTAAADRQIELSAIERALGTELRSLQVARDEIEAVTGWIADADETPLSELGFETLRARHETLSTHQKRCGDVLRNRQAVLKGRSCEGEVVLSHRGLVKHLYARFPAEYPVVATSARLIEVCEECQRTVRAHLVRRV